MHFDENRGFGFVSPDDGGDDVFLHVNDIQFDKRLLAPGVQLQFDTEEGDRGLKASRVSLVEGGSGRAGSDSRSQQDSRPLHDDGLCDVLPEHEFLEEVTEQLLAKASSLTGEQILAVRRCVTGLARSHGWIEG
ncbi:cold shock domain-containing protein [Amycolatopsis sp. PS_44_ISF1]|uniref:cold-shock protein n=1 Tax=Amycolatopsis sp. PS_44_ISF1 TaxID=2974917 RepID=UPI0028DFC387|nr:cold shock domain-containing protein [Amycolatopsis sp. PS_44_ISF1]MDT8911824.1 cold shock domain-containing protein [Amycolatopsis sp. PS_44_ISF1]